MSHANRAPVVFLVDMDRGSYAQAATLYESAFTAAGFIVETRRYEGTHDDLAGRWVVHHTIGPLFRPVAGARNTAVVFHEWSRYPAGWLATLNRFDSLWAPSRHVETILRESGAAAALHYVPPPLVGAGAAAPSRPAAGRPFRFLAVGEPHFRKGFHLLMEGFQQAFPSIGHATLTLKVSAACTWDSPRADIVLVRERLTDAQMDALYDAHDALVSASLGEGLGLPLAEAVDRHLPVAANLWGGHTDIIASDTAWPIAHSVVPQLFCSAPAYYADGQQCAYSSPRDIASTLRAIVEALPDERVRRAEGARLALRRGHDLATAAAHVRQFALRVD